MSLRKSIRQLKHEEKFTEEKKLLVMGDTTAAYDMEKVIVSAAGGEPFVSKLIPNSEDIGKKIITDLKLSGKGAFPKNSYPATKRWNQYFPSGAKGSTLTPKTDLMIGDKRISLKTGDAQLMSGGVNEASATFYVAAEESGTSLNEAVSNLGKHINNLLPSTDMRKLGIKGNKTQLKQMGKFAEIEILKNADDAHHAFKDDMRKVFKGNAAFAEAFTFEAMTGKVKFGDSLGTADHFLVTDYEGNANIHKVTSMSDTYVKKIAKQVKPDVKFKATQSRSSELTYVINCASSAKEMPRLIALYIFPGSHSNTLQLYFWAIDTVLSVEKLSTTICTISGLFDRIAWVLCKVASSVLSLLSVGVTITSFVIDYVFAKMCETPS